MVVENNYIARGAAIVDRITSGLKKVEEPVTIDKFNKIVLSAAKVTVPRFLGIPLRSTRKLEKELARFSQMGSESHL